MLRSCSCCYSSPFSCSSPSSFCFLLTAVPSSFFFFFYSFGCSIFSCPHVFFFTPHLLLSRSSLSSLWRTGNTLRLVKCSMFSVCSALLVCTFFTFLRSRLVIYSSRCSVLQFKCLAFDSNDFLHYFLFIRFVPFASGIVQLCNLPFALNATGDCLFWSRATFRSRNLSYATLSR